MSTYVVYHAGCNDGFGAAWCFHQVLGDEAVYRPSSYGDSPPSVEEGDRLYILDFSYPLEVMQDLVEMLPGNLTLLDHHQTAQDELAGKVPGCHFNLEKSGAVMAWNYWHPMDEPPELVKYVQDRDLWQWKLPASREWSAGMGLYPRDFEIWDLLNEHGSSFLISRGEVVLQYQRQVVDQLVSQVVPTTIGPYEVPSVNSPVLQSELGERLLQEHPEAPFVAIYYEHVERGSIYQVWSLRSRSAEECDVSEVAKNLNGGGHPCAAGFKLFKG